MPLAPEMRELVAAASEDSSGEERANATSLRTVKGGAAVGLVVTALCLSVASVAAAYSGMTESIEGAEEEARPRHRGGPMSARQLFESRRLAEIMTDNLLKVSMQEASQADREVARGALHGAVHGALQQTSAELEQEAPAVARELDDKTLSTKQQEAVLRVMRSMGDAKVQRLGRDLSADAGDWESGLARHWAELRALQELVSPSELATPGGGASAGEPEQVRLRGSARAWDVELDVSRPQAASAAAPAPAAPAGQAEAEARQALGPPFLAEDGALYRPTARRLFGLSEVMSMVGGVTDATGKASKLASALADTSKGYLHRFTGTVGAVGKLPAKLGGIAGDFKDCEVKSIGGFHLGDAWKCSTHFANSAIDAAKDTFHTVLTGKTAKTATATVSTDANKPSLTLR